MIARLEPVDERIPEKVRGIYSHLAGNVIETHGALDELMFCSARPKTSVY